MKKLLFVLLAIVMLVSVGCGQSAEEDDQAAAVGELTKDNPIQVNKEEGWISFLAQVNGKYFYEPTRHAAVFADGSNGDKAVFRGFVHHEDFYNALIEIGAKAGENMTMENKEQTKVQGDAFEVTVTWNGADKEYSIDDVIIDTNSNPIDIRFGGNLENAREFNTGCLICLDSCPVGITSNAAYRFGAVEQRNEVEFMGNKDILPPDGTYVAVTMKLM